MDIVIHIEASQSYTNSFYFRLQLLSSQYVISLLAFSLLRLVSDFFSTFDTIMKKKISFIFARLFLL